MMDSLLTFGLAFLLAWPIGRYMARIFSSERTLFDAVFNPIENFLFKLLGINANQGMSWRGYAKALLFSNLLIGSVAYLIFLLQGRLPFNPDGVPGMSWDLALHTAASFITNTNQQHYSGQAQLSYLSQMVAITALQFITPAAGLAALVAILRGLIGGRNTDAKAGETRDLGNYYVDVTKTITRVLIPFAFVLALLLTWQGIPSTFSGAKVATPLDSATGVTEQIIPVGPVAAMVAIKQLGTNGGGWYGPNSAVPLENPTPLSNLLETIAIILLPIAIVFMTGYFLKRRGVGMMILSVMTLSSILLTVAVVAAENQPNAAFAGLAAQGANMEGKEVRFGATASALWATLTTQTSNGSVNAMHDSFTPLGGMIPLVGMLINETYGGVGVGMINFFLFLVITVFIAGLMVGRTPELFGRKLEAKEIKLAAIALLIQPFLILVPTAITLAVPSLTSNSNPGFHGVAQVLYEYTSAFANNGSGFEGLGDNTVWWNVTTAINLILGRFIPIITPLAIAGYLARKRVAPESAGTLRVSTPIFAVTTFSVIILLTLLNFLPVLVLGPISEQLVSVPEIQKIQMTQNSVPEKLNLESDANAQAAYITFNLQSPLGEPQ
jgi:potassium-transporting ATPase potassium-binding subunit